jgi:membrane protease YdiL (CAAX protease family)
LYRGISKVSLLPQTLTFIALIAPMIGITEELLFRGFLQGKLSSINIYAAIVLTSFAHTLYKYLVLRSLPSDIGTDFFLLIVVTFIAGLMFGVLRVLSRSIIPSCLTHGVFDVLVYGGFSTWPVWVWS